MTSPVPSRDELVPMLVIASRNDKKIGELRRMLVDSSINVVGLDQFDVPETVEDLDTFEGNAVKKAREVAAATGLPALADDSGLVVDALDGDPGVHSARYAGVHGDDEANNAKLLDALAEVADDKRSARFVCVAAFVRPDALDEPIVARGEMEGVITRSPAGVGGFGYDPIFRPTGHSVTSAELSPGDKDAISHRGKAMRTIVPSIVDVLQPID